MGIKINTALEIYGTNLYVLGVLEPKEEYRKNS
jgi:hypothetical protein